jgi:hypothetical protein
MANDYCPLNNVPDEKVHMNMARLVRSETVTANDGTKKTVEYRSCSFGRESGTHEVVN